MIINTVQSSRWLTARWQSAHLSLHQTFRLCSDKQSGSHGYFLTINIQNLYYKLLYATYQCIGYFQKELASIKLITSLQNANTTT
jgi:hypothetical protein